MKKIKRLLALLLVCVISLSACAKGTDKASTGKPVIYTSFFPIYSLTKEIAGDTLDVRMFIPSGVDPHFWEPTPKNLKELSRADLLIVNGANMEKWVDKVSDNIPKLRVLTLSDSVDLITYKGAAAKGDFQYMTSLDLKKDEKYYFDFGHTHEDLMRVAFIKNDKNLSKEKLIERGKEIMQEDGDPIRQKATIKVKNNRVYGLEMGHESGKIFFKVPNNGNWVMVSDRISEKLLPYDLMDKKGNKIDNKTLLAGSTSGLDKVTYDPHSWLSIKNAKRYLNAISHELSQIYPENKHIYASNKSKSVSRLTELEYKYKEELKKYNKKSFVTSHYAYEYLARDFGLNQYPLQGLISSDTPSLKTIRKAIRYCESNNIKTIFYEDGLEQKGADTLASEISGKTLPLRSMEYVKINSRDSYIEIMEDNLKKIISSFKEE